MPDQKPTKKQPPVLDELDAAAKVRLRLCAMPPSRKITQTSPFEEAIINLTHNTG